MAYTSVTGGADAIAAAERLIQHLPIRVTHPLTGEPLTIGHCRVTECEMTGGQKKDTRPGDPRYGLSYGLVFGQNERKAISMSLLDSSLMAGSTEEGNPAPANDQEMVLSNTDGIESFGFVEHLKLPHFVTFGSGLEVSSTKPADVEIEDPVIDELDVDDARELAGVGAASTEGSSS